MEGFDAIGMPEVTKIIETAAELVGNPFPFENEMRKEIVGPPNQRMDFSDLDSEFYALADTNKFFRR